MVKNSKKIIAEIKNLFLESQKDSASLREINQELVLNYWEIGKRISNLLEDSKIEQSTAFLNDLAQKLGLMPTILFQSLQFFNCYPKFNSKNSLSWSHYRLLVTVKDATNRMNLEKKAHSENWSSRQLKIAINALKDQKAANILAASAGTTSKKTNRKIENSKNISNKITRPSAPTYLYKAKIEKVIDGDTLILNIDLGFDVWKSQRIRLAQINAPEMKTSEGQKSFEFLQELLKDVENVMIKTNKVDIYGRFIGDVFLGDNKNAAKKLSPENIFLKGEYLNQMILDAGMAVVLKM